MVLRNHFAAVLVCLCVSFQPAQVTTGNRYCLVPPYSVLLHEMNVTAEGEALLLTEGRCYLACLREGGDFQNFTTRQEVLYPAWPFPIVHRECATQQEIHECTRGCRVLLLDSGLPQAPLDTTDRNSILDQCLVNCSAECQEECGGVGNCTNSDTSDLWLAVSGCPVKCSTATFCQSGCQTGEYILAVVPLTPPPRPLAPPTLTPLTNLPKEAFRAGVYSVNLTSAMPSVGQGTPPLYGFLFKIEDNLSGNITHFWQHDPRENLDLSSHACRNVDVSFAVVNEQGTSEFSEAVTVDVYGDILVPPTVTPGRSDPVISVLTRDRTPLHVKMTFSITQAKPAVDPKDIFWTYSPKENPADSIDVKALVQNSSKYEFSNDFKTLTIFNLGLSDGGVFTLSATNEAGMDSASQELVIHVEPELLSESYSGIKTTEGETATFTCEASGFPAPNIVWLHNLSYIIQTSRRVITTDSAVLSNDSVVILMNSTLLVNSLSLWDGGEYMCRVDPYDILGGRSDFSNTMQLQVEAAPTNFCEDMPCENNGTCSNQTESYLCTCDPNNWRGVNCMIPIQFSDFSEAVAWIEDPELLSFLNSRVTLTCGSFGIPDPNITWYKDDELLPGEGSSTLVIQEIGLRDRGNYHCRATNFDPSVAMSEMDNIFEQNTEKIFVKIAGVAQYLLGVTSRQSSSRGQQSLASSEDQLSVAEQLSRGLSGVKVGTDATILSIGEYEIGDNSVIVTILAPAGGSPALSEQLYSRLLLSAAEFNIMYNGSLLRFDGCGAETVTVPLADLEEPVLLDWPEINLGEIASVQWDPCEDLTALGGISIRRTAIRTCEGTFTMRASWGPPMIQVEYNFDFTPTSRRLCNVANVIDEPGLAIDELKSITAKPEDIDSLDVGIISTLLSALFADAQGNETLSTGLFEVVDNVLGVESSILQSSQMKSNSSGRILEIMEALAVSYPIPEIDASDSINFDLTHLSVTISQVDQEMFAGFEFTPSPANVTENGKQPSDLPFSTVSLSTPPSLFDNITLPHTSENGSSLPRISNIVYETDGLFLGPFSFNPIVVTSVIATATLSVGSHIVELSDLDPPIILVFAKLDSISNISCASWNFDGYGSWSPDNCIVKENNETFVVCECTHFADFAVITMKTPDPDDDLIDDGGLNFGIIFIPMKTPDPDDDLLRDDEPNFGIIFNPNPIANDPESNLTNGTLDILPSEVAAALSAVSYIGVIVSIISLIMTIITYLWSKKLRNLDAGQMLIHISFGLLGIYVMFLVGLYATEPEPLCAVAGGLLHYFMLVTFFLMGAEAISLYLKFVVVLGIPEFLDNRYVLKGTLISWITPLFIVIASEAPNWRNYVSPIFCRPYGAPFFGGFVAPFAIIYIMNWVIFIIIFISLWRKRRNSEVGDKEDVKTRLRQQFIAALTLSLLFGLGWGVGFATTSSITSVPLSTTLQAIFILLTSFQGLVIFIMQCVRCEEARNVWKEWIYIITCHKVKLGKMKTLTSRSTAMSLRSQSTAIFRLNSRTAPNGRTTRTLKSGSVTQKKLENGESCVHETTLPNAENMGEKLLPPKRSSAADSVSPSLSARNLDTLPEDDSVNLIPLPDTSNILPAGYRTTETPPKSSIPLTGEVV